MDLLQLNCKFLILYRKIEGKYSLLPVSGGSFYYMTPIKQARKNIYDWLKEEKHIFFTKDDIDLFHNLLMEYKKAIIDLELKENKS